MAARDALKAVGMELARLGVKSAFGTAGTFKELLLVEDGKTCVGVRAIDGTEWAGDLVVLACGAWSSSLLNLEGQCVSKVRFDFSVVLKIVLAIWPYQARS